MHSEPVKRKGKLERCLSWVGCLAAVALATVPAAAEDWTSWGGPRGDLTVDSGRLAETWPGAGPRRLWQRTLGAGYSSILAADGRLFTMYRDGDDDVLVALDAATGATVWEERDRPVFWPEMTRQFGLGPNATPLLVGDTVVGIGISGRMRALDAKTGRRRWQRDLSADFGRPTVFVRDEEKILALDLAPRVSASGEKDTTQRSSRSPEP